MRSRLFVILPLIFCLFLPASVWAAAQYKVSRVESWDTLNMRSGPGVKNAVVAQLPHNAINVNLVGGVKTIGRTHWVRVSWQGKTGWVSKSYLTQQQGTQPVQTADKNKAAPAETVSKTVPPPAKPEPKVIVKEKHSGMWILECGNTSPYWKIDILPEWIRGTLGNHKTGMPITHKRQNHGKYHKVALETEIRGSNRWNRIRMTMNYTKSCYSRLARKKVAFSVKGMFNNEEISGCCRAMQVP